MSNVFKDKIKVRKIWLEPDFYLNPVQKFRIASSALGSYHQSDSTFGANAGAQLPCNLLLAFSQIFVVLSTNNLLHIFCKDHKSYPADYLPSAFEQNIVTLF